MKNLTTKEFCRKFGACAEGTAFAQNYKTMRECYAALLRGDAGPHSPLWAIWAATRNGVMPERDLRIFAVRCARRVQHLMTDERSIHALDVAERYANGDATAEELVVARSAAESAWSAAYAAARSAAYAAARSAAALAAESAWSAAYAAARSAARSAAYAAAWSAADREAQLRILAQFSNPFEEAEE